MKNNINIYDVLNNLYNLSGLEEIDSDELEGLDFTVDKKRILEIRKNSVKKNNSITRYFNKEEKIYFDCSSCYFADWNRCDE